MFDFRLKVFHTVANRLNFTRAAEELFISQPAVTKHIKEIESYYKTRLFERKGTGISLTPAGKTLLAHTEELFSVYRKIDTEMAALNEDLKGVLRIGASTTLAQYVLPKYLPEFREKHPAVEIILSAHNTERIENDLLAGTIDIGVVEGSSRRKQLRYSKLLKDEIVLCTAIGNPTAKKGSITLDQLTKLPLLMREQGSGTLEVISGALKEAGITLDMLPAEMVLDSTESMKAYLLHSHAFAFVSIHSVLAELESSKLRLVDIHRFAIERNFYIVRQMGENQPLTELFVRFLNSHNLR